MRQSVWPRVKRKKKKKRTRFLLLKIEFQSPLIFHISVCCSSLLTFKGTASKFSRPEGHKTPEPVTGQSATHQGEKHQVAH